MFVVLEIPGLLDRYIIHLTLSNEVCQSYFIIVLTGIHLFSYSQDHKHCECYGLSYIRLIVTHHSEQNDMAKYLVNSKT